MAIFFNHIKGCGKNTTGTYNNGLPTGSSSLFNTNSIKNTELDDPIVVNEAWC